MNSWQILWFNKHVLIKGFENTLYLFTISSFLAGLISILLVFLLEDINIFIKKLILIIVNVIRMLPFLIYVYIIYYILPYFNIKFSAWNTGLIALATYHGAYFFEILIHSRDALSKGQIDSAIAYGFTIWKMIFYIILPQILLRSGSLICNQLIYLLKDTAFLTIITIMELTGSAFLIQSKYFIPMEAFLLVIVLYWILNIIITIFAKKLDNLLILKGLGNE